MEKTKNQIMLCDCEGTMRLDAKAIGEALEGADIKTHTALCRSQIEALSLAVKGTTPVCVACTQEIPIFLEVLDGQENPPPVTYVNIRERAGWSHEGTKATAKIAALVAESQIKVEPAKNLILTSEGKVIVLGKDEQALDAARRLSSRLDVTIIFTDPASAGNITPLQLMDIPVFCGKVVSATGHLGSFKVSLSKLSASDPSSKDGYSFQQSGQQAALSADLILDLQDSDPLFNAPEKCDGYFNPATNDLVAVERALFELADMVGEFEKPRYIKYQSAICAHDRNGIPGCNICVDLCPTGAITSADEQVAIDPYVCAGCGSCAGACPSGAAEYTMPSGIDVLSRLRALLGTYLKAGGKDPVLLVHDREFGDEMIAIIARSGKGLPANVLPFLLNEVTQAGLDGLLTTIAYGAAQVLVLASPHKSEEQNGLREQITISNSILHGLGYGKDRLAIIDEADPQVVESVLYDLKTPASVGSASFITLGAKRQRLNQILESLYKQAPQPVDVIELEAGAPFGAVHIDVEGCTLCLACVNACPAKALRDNPDAPELRFQESNCIQCGLCKSTCPESVITLSPRIDFKAIGVQAIILKEEEPFHCVRCEKPFGVSSTIERMIEKMSGHNMFQDPKSLNRLRMCDNCRVIDMSEGKDDPWASKQRTTKTTEDYLKEREELRAQAAKAMKGDDT